MTTEKLIKNFEREINRKGDELSKPLHKRARQIIEKLKPRFKIVSLSMGMGVYSFETEPFDIVYSDDSNDTMGNGDDFTNYLENPRHSFCWKPVGVTDDEVELIDELREILDFLTDETYADLMQYP